MEKTNNSGKNQNKIYTRNGDQGKTKINSNTKISKRDPRVKAWGALDELEAHIGHLRAKTDNTKINQELKTVQKHLHIIMAQITNKQNKEEQSKQTPQLKKEHVKLLEEKIDQHTEKLPDLKRFIYSSGTPEATYAQVTRTIARKTEVRINELDKVKELPEEIKQYTNRLSDYLFTVARYLNHDQGFGDEFVDYD